MRANTSVIPRCEFFDLGDRLRIRIVWKDGQRTAAYRRPSHGQCRVTTLLRSCSCTATHAADFLVFLAGKFQPLAAPRPRANRASRRQAHLAWPNVLSVSSLFSLSAWTEFTDMSNNRANSFCVGLMRWNCQ